MRKRVVLTGILMAVLALLSACRAAEEFAGEQRQIVYENKEIGIGFLLPAGYEESPFGVEENQGESGIVIGFLEPETGALVFSIGCFDRDDWEQEIKENFSVPYTVLYEDTEKAILCLDVSDVQYAAEDTEQKETYLALLELKEEVCESLYFISE